MGFKIEPKATTVSHKTGFLSRQVSKLGGRYVRHLIFEGMGLLFW
jgi:hypothetical protein